MKSKFKQERDNREKKENVFREKHFQ